MKETNRSDKFRLHYRLTVRRIRALDTANNHLMDEIAALCKKRAVITASISRKRRELSKGQAKRATIRINS